MRAIPTAPLLLGIAGLIPFWALALSLPLTSGFGFDKAALDLALATYAAVIISFLGGIRWGLASARADQVKIHFVVSVVPSLIAWALLLLPEPWRLASLGVVALALGPIDARLVQEGLSPRWLGKLRIILSSGAGVALLLAAYAMTLNI